MRIDAALCCTSTVLALSFKADWASAHVWLEGFNIQEEGPAGWRGQQETAVTQGVFISHRDGDIKYR